MFKSISIEGLRGIKHLEIDDLQRVNLLVGKNNCGKTTVLEAILLITAPTNAELPLKINLVRGLKEINENTWKTLYNKMNIEENIKISGKMQGNEIRNLIIKPNSGKRIISKLAKNNFEKKVFEIKDNISGISPSIDGLVMELSITKGKSRHVEKATAMITENNQNQNIEIQIPAGYKEIIKCVFINGKTVSSDIGEKFDNIQVKKQTGSIIKILRQIEPSLDNLVMGVNEMINCDIGMDNLLPLSVMGDGMIKLLSVILSISNTQDGVVLIDEIENGFHYSAMEVLWQAVFDAAKEFNVQVFATTHSYECVKAFNSACSKIGRKIDGIRLFRIEKQDDDFGVVAYDNEILKASLESDWEVR